MTWCKGRTTQPNGIKLTWNELGELLVSKEARKEALKAARKV